MEKKIRRTHKNNLSASYISGTAVRKYSPAYEDNREYTYRSKKVKAVKEKYMEEIDKKRQKELSLQMHPVYLTLLVVALFVILCLGYNFLSINSKVISDLKQIEKLEKDLDVLKNENDGLESSIKSFRPDLDYVYKVATEELGMVKADRSQIKTYTNSEKEYVRQYEDIP